MHSKKLLKIYVDRLKSGDTESIDEKVTPDFLEAEKELSFPAEVTISGRAYLANDHLILQLKIKTKARLPCSMCNQTLETSLEVPDFYLTVDLTDLPSAIYDYTDEVRSALLLKVPQFTECNEGSCPNRPDINKYFKSPSKTDDGNHYPFSTLSP